MQDVTERSVTFQHGQFYTVRQIAAACNVRPCQVSKWLRYGLLPASRISHVQVATGDDVRKALIKHLRGEIRLPLSVGRELRVPDDIRQEAL